MCEFGGLSTTGERVEIGEMMVSSDEVAEADPYAEPEPGAEVDAGLKTEPDEMWVAVGSRGEAGDSGSANGSRLAVSAEVDTGVGVSVLPCDCRASLRAGIKVYAGWSNGFAWSVVAVWSD